MGRLRAHLGPPRHPAHARPRSVLLPPWCLGSLDCLCTTYCNNCLQAGQRVVCEAGACQLVTSDSVTSGTYKIPTANDIAVDFRVTLLKVR